MELNIKSSDVLLDIYCCLPDRFRRFISSIIEPAGYRFFGLTQQIFISTYLIKVKDKKSGSVLLILYLGDKRSLSYLSNMFYTKEVKIREIGNFFIWNAKKKINQFSSKIDMVFIKTDRFFSQSLQKKGFIVIPEWIEMILDISGSVEKINKNFSKGTKKDIRRIKKFEYSYEISTDPKKLKFFYNKMYLPYISKKYGKTALIMKYNYMSKIFGKGKLLLVKSGKEYVSGGIISTKKDMAHLLCMGVRGGESKYIKQGAAIAADYYHIIWAKENGIRTLNFGDNRPFLNDGVFQYKRKWGMAARQSRAMTNTICFKIYNFSKGVQSFLVNNPFIYIDKDQLKAFIFIKKDNPVNNDELQHLLKKYYTPGLTELTINSSQGFTQDIEEKFSLNHQEKTFHAIFMKRNNAISVINNSKGEGAGFEECLVLSEDYL